MGLTAKAGENKPHLAEMCIERRTSNTSVGRTKRGILQVGGDTGLEGVIHRKSNVKLNNKSA